MSIEAPILADNTLATRFGHQDPRINVTMSASSVRVSFPVKSFDWSVASSKKRAILAIDDAAVE